MSTKSPTQRESIDLPTTTSLLGTDAEGATHYYSSPVDGTTVYVVEADDDVTEWDLAETPCSGLGDWVDHTERVRGWDCVHYSDGVPLATLADRLAAAEADH